MATRQRLTDSQTGPSFARNQLEKYGWEKGKGLGKTESGITDAIKPKLKFDTAGVGHTTGEQFSFHWWDHVFNQAAKNIEVEQSEEGVMVNQRGKKSNLISNKRTAQQAKPKALLYGSFVKHGTLKPDGLISQNDQSSSSSDDSDTEELPPESYEGNDERLFRACGGRTAHKGARHGLHLSGKLKRIEEQENLHKDVEKTGLDYDKQGKKKQKESPEFGDHQMPCAEVDGEDLYQKVEVDMQAIIAGQDVITDIEVITGKKKQKKKKKRNKEKKCSQSEHEINHYHCIDKIFSGHSVDEKLHKIADSKNVKRNKKHKKEYLDGEKEWLCARDGDSRDDSWLGQSFPMKKKKKKNRKRELFKAIKEEDITLAEDKAPNQHN